jgi:K+-sensing histidine kinase KdpD
LRNPLAAIASSVALTSGPGAHTGRALDVLQRQTRHMTRLINNPLDVTRVTHGILRLGRMSVDLGAGVAVG